MYVVGAGTLRYKQIVEVIDAAKGAGGGNQIERQLRAAQFGRPSSVRRCIEAPTGAGVE
jgi:hypothetical protein